MRNRRGLNRIGMLALAMVLALGAMGVAYGAWVDEIYIEGTVYTGSINAGLTCGTCWEEVGGIEVNVPDTDIDCTGGSMTLTIDVTNALEDVDYYCEFDVSNAVGSLPVKIDTMSITGSYPGVSKAIELLSEGDVIDPGDTATGKVHIYVTSQTDPLQNPAYTLAVTVVLWNE